MSVVWNKAFALKFIFTHCYFFSKITFLRNNSNTQTEISTTVGAVVPHEKIFGYNWRFFGHWNENIGLYENFSEKWQRMFFKTFLKRKFYLKLFRQILFLKKYFFKSYYRFTSKDLTWNWKFYVAPLAKSCSSSNNVKKGT